MAEARAWMAAVAAMALAACNSLSDSIGLNPRAPDEFTVVAQAPLTMPPNFALRPPVPGAPRPQTLDVQQQAQATLLGAAPAGGGARTPGEEALLANAGADQAEPGIRALVDLENAQLLALNQGFLQQLLAFQRPSTVINPVEEAERLRAEGAVGLPPNIGQAPSARRR